MKTKLSPTRMAALLGLTAVAVLVLTTIITIIPYRGRLGEHYSFLNHFISELGEVGVSRFASLFNSGLIAFGALFLLFVLLLGTYLKHWFAWIAVAVEAYAAIMVLLVGALPMNMLEPHTFVALEFFEKGMIALGLFTVFVLFFKASKLPRWLSLPGLLAVLCFVGFLYLPGWLGIDFTLELGDDRPAVWFLSIMEWSIFLAMGSWLLLVSLHLWRRPGAGTHDAR